MKHVEEIPFEDARNPEKADIIFSDKNQSFYRRDSEGREYCWMAVDAETGTVEFKDPEGNSLLLLDAEQGKLFIGSERLVCTSDISDMQTKEDANSTYLSQFKAAEDYQTKPPKDSHFITNTELDGKNLASEDDISDMETATNAENTYLSQNTAKRHYQKKPSDGLHFITNRELNEKKLASQDQVGRVERTLDACVKKTKRFNFTIPFNNQGFVEAFQMGWKDGHYKELTCFAYLNYRHHNKRTAIINVELESCKTDAQYLEYKVTRQTDGVSEEEIRSGKVYNHGVHIYQTFTILDDYYYKNRTYRLYFKKTGVNRTATLNGRFTVVQL